MRTDPPNPTRLPITGRIVSRDAVGVGSATRLHRSSVTREPSKNWASKDTSWSHCGFRAPRIFPDSFLWQGERRSSSQSFHVPPVGLVLLAAITSVPELVTGVSSAALVGLPDLARRPHQVFLSVLPKPLWHQKQHRISAVTWDGAHHPASKPQQG